MPRVTVNEQNDHNNGRKQRFLDDDINIEKGYFFLIDMEFVCFEMRNVDVRVGIYCMRGI